MSTNGPQPSSLRKNHGRGHSYWIDGEKVAGLTTDLLGKGFPKPALINWAGEETARYAVNNWDDLAELKVGDRLKQLYRARFETQDEAKLRGTRLHELARRHTLGEEVTVPEPLLGHFEQYERFLEEWDVADLVVERPFFSRRRRYGGTPDLVAELADGQTWLLDYKSTAKGVFLEHVLQLAALRYADYMLDDAGNEVPIPPIDAAGAVWLRADGYDLIPVEANEDAYRTFLYVREVARYVGDERDNWIGDALAPPVEVPRA